MDAALFGVTLSRSGRQSRATQRLEEYLASLRAPNRYGYLPIGLEWDLWWVRAGRGGGGTF